ncbi:MAG TPA: hypothetical protein VHI75_06790, partial [Casimicrobiaceae bacterium]|nr:hypothetical protein [Casimicrobiaceae bacterium]
NAGLLESVSLGNARTAAGTNWPATKQILRDGMPERLAEGIQAEHAGRDRSGFEAFDPFGAPVHIAEPQPHRELVESNSVAFIQVAIALAARGESLHGLRAARRDPC